MNSGGRGSRVKPPRPPGPRADGAGTRRMRASSAGVGVARDAELATNRPSMDNPAPLAI